MKAFKKLQPWIIGGLLVLLVGNYIQLRTERGKIAQLEAEYKLLQKEYEEYKNTVQNFADDRKREKDSLEIEISLREMENRKLSQDVSHLKRRIEILSNRPIEVPSKPTELTSYFNERYETNENVVIEDKVGLGKETAYNTVYELEQKDIYETIIPLKDSIISFNELQISNLYKDKNNLSGMLGKAEEEISMRINLQQKAENNIKNLEQQNKIIRRRSKLKSYLIPIGVAVGGFAGFKIAK